MADELPSRPPSAITPAGEWKPVPYAQRRSQNLNFIDYLKEKIIRILIGGGAGGFIANQGAKLLGAHDEARSTLTAVGILVGGEIAGFRDWKKEEGRHLTVDELYNEYKQLPGLQRSNQEITADNAVLKQMLAFERAKHTPASHVAASTAHRDGLVAESTREQSV